MEITCGRCKGIGVIGPVEKREEIELIDFDAIRNGTMDLKEQLAAGKKPFREVWADTCPLCKGLGKQPMDESEMTGDEKSLLWELNSGDQRINPKLIIFEYVRRINYLAYKLKIDKVHAKVALFKSNCHFRKQDGFLISFCDAPMPTH